VNLRSTFSLNNRVEIRSPGLLYGGLTISDIRRKMLSERRNEMMAELFHRLLFIEKWGRRIKMILEREPQTEFEELGTYFIATFKRKSFEASPPARIGESSEKSSEKILAAIASNPEIRVRQIAEMLGLTPRGVEKQLDKLRKQGVLKRIGPDKGGHREIV
jgi:ATP-dependent DNA helicase RecG